MAVQIRQELNIIDGVAGGASGVVLGADGIIQIDSTRYNGTVTVYLEANISTAHAGNTLTLRRIGTTTDDASVSVASTGLVRSTGFTPVAGQTQYGIFSASTTVRVKNARAIIIQNATALTNTETQIEIGNQATTISTTDVPVTNPKYWKYTAANWDGTKTFYFEAVFKTQSTKCVATVTLQTSAAIDTPSWSDVASSVVTTTSTTTTRVRSGAITLVDGNWYQVVFKSVSTKETTTLYRAGIVVDQESTSQIDDSYGEENQSTSDMRGNDLTAFGDGQSFTSQGGTLFYTKFYLHKSASPTGNCVSKIYEHTGVFGTSSKPTGSALATSENIDITTLSTTAALIRFNFSGVNQITLTAGTKYFVSVEYNGGDGTNNLKVNTDFTSPTHSGNKAFSTDDDPVTWLAAPATDAIFYVFTLVDYITKLEPQYLLANTLFAAGTGLQTHLTKWDSSEWSGVTNTYYFQAEAADGSTSDVELWEADGGGSAIGTVTNIDNSQISSAMTMPSDQNLDVKATTNAGDVSSTRILVLITISAGTSLSQSLADAVSIVISKTVSPIKTKTESIGFSENLAKASAYIRALIEALSINEAIKLSFSIEKSELVNITEVMSTQTGKSLSVVDIFTLIEQISLLTGKNISESLNIVETNNSEHREISLIHFLSLNLYKNSLVSHFQKLLH